MCGTCGCDAKTSLANEDAHRHITVERDLLHHNNAHAAANRRAFAAADLLAINLMSGPGAGKTSLLEATFPRLPARLAAAVIVGDQHTENDAARLRARGVAAAQINTGKLCHLDAHMVGHALDDLAPLEGGLLFIENVGNLVCPAAFDLGENFRVVLAAVTEGEDKPLKYPYMFAGADLMLITKCDLLPHLECSLARLAENARKINGQIHAIALSARTGEGMDAWLAWLMAARQELRAAP
ncbi:MAG: hydrogenase nickel incorporation protein HypB [Pseudomonadota bacterium]